MNPSQNLLVLIKKACSFKNTDNTISSQLYASKSLSTTKCNTVKVKNEGINPLEYNATQNVDFVLTFWVKKITKVSAQYVVQI